MEGTQSRFKRICVFCGSSSGKKPTYQSAAVELGQELVFFSQSMIWVFIFMHFNHSLLHFFQNPFRKIPSFLFPKYCILTLGTKSTLIWHKVILSIFLFVKTNQAFSFISLPFQKVLSFHFHITTHPLEVFEVWIWTHHLQPRGRGRGRERERQWDLSCNLPVSWAAFLHDLNMF